MTRKALEVLGRSAGGIATHVASVVEGLDRRNGLQVDVAGPEDLPVPMPKPVIPVDIPPGPLRGHPTAIRRLGTVVEQGDYDIVHAHGLRAGIDAGIAARRTHARSFVSIHNLVRSDITGRVRAFFYRWAEPLSVRLNDKVFAASEEIAQHLRARIPRHAEKIEVLLLGVGVEPGVERPAREIRKELHVPEDGRLVVTAGRLHPQKALHVMLEAVAKLPTDVVLAVLGEGPLEQELKSRADSLGISARVSWLGFRPDVHDYLAAADVFCMSSRWEAVALAAKEAVLAGTPVVATDVGGMSELFTDRVSGRLVPAEDHAALAGALLEVLGDEKMARSYAEEAARMLRARFSTGAMLDALYRAYTEPG